MGKPGLPLRNSNAQNLLSNVSRAECITLLGLQPLEHIDLCRGACRVVFVRN